jgi:DNA-binding CsgD family transcriptional regulator
MAVSAQLRGPDARAVLDLSAAMAQATHAEDLREAMFELPAAIGADGLLDARMENPRGGSLRIAAQVTDASLYQSVIVEEVVTRWWRRHPIVARHVLHPTPEPVMVSDFLTGAQWRRNVVFNEGYRVLGITHELSLQFAWAPGRTACAALHRAGPDFAERDRAMLAALAPHIRAAYARVAEHAALSDRVALLEAGIEAAGEGVLLVGPGGRVLAAGATARRLLRIWFGARGTLRRLPGELLDWHARARLEEAPVRLLCVRSGRRLRVTVVAGREEDVLILREDSDEPLSADALLAALPVTRREAEVLALLADGLTNAAIAHELGLSTRTVGHHVEHLFAKLGTPNRAAATAAALAAVAA